jgi:D-alanine transaminase
MNRVSYVNGRYLPHRLAGVHVEDRGYQFADGVYEVIAVHQGWLVDEDLHLQRLGRSLAALEMAWPMSEMALRLVLRQMIRRNRIVERGSVYLQVTRGTAPRNHAFPPPQRSTLVLTARRLPPFSYVAARQGVAVITAPDLRWRRRDIKSVSLLPNVLGKQQAVCEGAFEAWLVEDDGTITEGTASNAWIVSAAGELVTRPADWSILNGITRTVVLGEARQMGIPVREGPFSVDDAKAAREAFLTSTTSVVRPVIRIDDTIIGSGDIGPVTDRLLKACIAQLNALAARSSALPPATVGKVPC